MLKLSTRTTVTIARLLSQVIRTMRLVTGRASTGVFKREGIRYELDLAEGIDLAIYLFGSFEHEVVGYCRTVLKSGDTAVDIGANIGAHSLHMAGMVGPDGRVIACEPTAYAFAKLGRNLALNPDLAGRVTARQVFLTDAAHLQLPAQVVSSWPLRAGDDLPPDPAYGAGKPTTGASVLTLDSLVSSVGDRRIALLKIDVDGNEPVVLGGAQDCLKRHRPAIILELAPVTAAEGDNTLVRLLEHLRSTGYTRVTHRRQTFGIADHSAILGRIPSQGSINVLIR